MLAGLRLSKFKLVVTALFAMAMLSLGFAHRPVETRDGSSLSVTASFLPDGTPIKICGQAQDAPAGKKGCNSCDACRLTATAGLLFSPPSPVTAPERSARLALVLALASPARTPALEPQSRGPPLA